MSEKRLKIAVNTRLLLKGKLEGIGWFTFEIFKRIANNHPEVDFYFIFDRPFDEAFVFSKNVHPIVIGPQARHPILFKIWFNYSIKKLFKKLEPDLFVSPDGYLSLTTTVKQLAVIHDLNFEHHPEVMPLKDLKFYKKYFPKFANIATRIVTVSETSKKDIEKTYDISSSKIDVVYNAAGDNYFEISDSEKQEVKHRLTNNENYFVFVGSINPRKNPIALVEAFDQFKNQTMSNFKLVIVGNKMWSYKAFDEALNRMTHKQDVVFTGHVDQVELNRVVSSAYALVFVSLFEGFGIPLVEAMKSRTAIISSNLSVMPEVCGDSTIYVDPNDVNDVVDKMTTLVNSKDLREELILKGDDQLKKFDWDTSAKKMWESIQKTI